MLDFRMTGLLLEAFPGSVIYQHTNPMKVPKDVRNNRVDAVFAEIEMGKLSGMELARILYMEKADLSVVLLSDTEPGKKTTVEKVSPICLARPLSVDLLRKQLSRVSGTLDQDADHIKEFIDTFPAGTLSGAPKVRAMQIISELEPHNRGAYGGCIGFIGLNGDLNQAIVIRTFISRNGELWFQAGSGVVAKSNDQYELEECNNKLGALTKAIHIAEKL